MENYDEVEQNVEQLEDELEEVEEELEQKEEGFLECERWRCFLLLITVGVSGIIYIIFNLFFIPYKREKLFVNGIFGALAVIWHGFR